MAKVRKVFLKNLQNNAKITDNAFLMVFLVLALALFWSQSNINHHMSI
jgi:hypothetical protein